MNSETTPTGTPVECIVRLSSDQLFALQNAVDFTLSEHKRLHWNIVSLMEPGKVRVAQLRMTQRLASESNKLEAAMKTVCRMFENQFKRRTLGI